MILRLGQEQISSSNFTEFHFTCVFSRFKKVPELPSTLYVILLHKEDTPHFNEGLFPNLLATHPSSIVEGSGWETSKLTNFPIISFFSQTND